MVRNPTKSSLVEVHRGQWCMTWAENCSLGWPPLRKKRAIFNSFWSFWYVHQDPLMFSSWTTMMHYLNIQSKEYCSRSVLGAFNLSFTLGKLHWYLEKKLWSSLRKDGIEKKFILSNKIIKSTWLMWASAVHGMNESLSLVI